MQTFTFTITHITEAGVHIAQTIEVESKSLAAAWRKVVAEATKPDATPNGVAAELGFIRLEDI